MLFRGEASNSLFILHAGIVCFEPVQILYELPVSDLSYMCQPCYVRKMLFPCTYPPLLSLRTFCLQYCIDPWDLESHVRAGKDIPLRVEWSKVSHSLSTIQLCIPMLISIYTKKKLFWWMLNKLLIYRQSNLSLGIILLLCSFNRMIEVSFPELTSSLKWSQICDLKYILLYCSNFSSCQITICMWLLMLLYELCLK